MQQIKQRFKVNRETSLFFEYCKISLPDLNWAYNLKPCEWKLFIACWISDSFSSQFQVLKDFNWKSRNCSKARKEIEPQGPFQFQKVVDYTRNKSVAYLEIKKISWTFQRYKKVPTNNQKNCKYCNSHNLYQLETPPFHKELVFKNHEHFIEYSPELEKQQKLDKYRKLITLLSEQHLKRWDEIFIRNFYNKSRIINNFLSKQIYGLNCISEIRGCSK